MRKLLPFFLACLSGIILNLPWIAGGWGFALFFAFIPLLLIDTINHSPTGERSSTTVFLYGFGAFLIWNIGTCWWMAFVTVWGMLFVTTMNALLMAAVWWCRYRVSIQFGKSSGLFSLVVFWLAFEYLSHYGLLPWPWLVLGNGLANSVKTIQWYEYTGVLGGSLWILTINVLIFKLIQEWRLKFNLKVFAVLISIIVVPVVLSLLRYDSYSENGKLQNVAIIQPDINPYTEKFSVLSEYEQVQRLVHLAENQTLDSINFIVAPETAIPVVNFTGKLPNDTILFPIKRLVKKYPGVKFITGAITKWNNPESDKDLSKMQSGQSIYNSSILIDTSPNVLVCHKNILVAGVEKEPFQEYLPFLPEFLIDLGGMKGGLNSGMVPGLFLTPENIKIGAVICFESVFGTYVRRIVSSGADFLVVQTNDGWWKDSNGVNQHFSYSRIRAIETRRSIIRSANTGISGIINQRGDLIKTSGVNTAEAIVSQIKTNDTLTFYVLYGNYLGVLSLILSGLIGLFFVYKKSGLDRT